MVDSVEVVLVNRWVGAVFRWIPSLLEEGLNEWWTMKNKDPQIGIRVLD